jgi:predicted Zn-dependent protease
MIEIRRTVRLALCCCVARMGWIASDSSAQAERRKPSAEKPDFSQGAEQFFGPFFHETEAERAAIEDVAIDQREEWQFGERELQSYLASLRQRRIRVRQGGRDVDYISSLVELIHPRMQHAERYEKIHVYVADSTETDARAFPGGSIVVMTGLVDFAENEAALVGVLGHELSHIDHGHQLRMARAAKLAQSGWNFRDGAPQDMQRNIMVMSKNFARPFNSEDEAIADHDGATWAFELGYNPLEMAKVFQRFDERQRRTQSRQAPMPSFLRTHPYHAERYEAVKELSDEMRRKSPGVKLYVGAANLRKRTPRSEAAFPE